MPPKATPKGKKVRGRKKVPPQPMVASKRPSKGGGAALDAWGRAYANLLRDPCYGRLVPPTFSGSAGGILTRFETDFVVNGAATDMGAFIAFTPGILGLSTTTYGSVMGATGAITGDGTTITTQNTPSRQPGVALAPSMAASRCLSACLQVSYMGSELTRSGICSVGQLTYNDLNGPVSFSLSTLRAMSSTVVKIPDGEVEIKLRPTAESETFYPVNAVANTNLAAHPSLVATMSGYPANTGMRVRLVAVYEWIPQSASGVVASEGNSSKSLNTLTQVVHALDAASPRWAVTLLTAATKIAPAITAFA
jgi:hypothetical protein